MVHYLRSHFKFICLKKGKPFRSHQMTKTRVSSTVGAQDDDKAHCGSHVFFRLRMIHVKFLCPGEMHFAQ